MFLSFSHNAYSTLFSVPGDFTICRSSDESRGMLRIFSGCYLRAVRNSSSCFLIRFHISVATFCMVCRKLIYSDSVWTKLKLEAMRLIHWKLLGRWATSKLNKKARFWRPALSLSSTFTLHVSEALVFNSNSTRLIVQEDFSVFLRRRKLKSYKI
jgi:hypothetical protein